MANVVVFAPHPDDETLGCGATLLKHLAKGDQVSWVIVTRMTEQMGFDAERQAKRQAEIEQVAEAYGFHHVFELGFPVAELDRVAMKDLVGACSEVIQQTQANVLYLPYRGDAHSDHAYVYDAVSACTKNFRYPSVRSVRVYETLSETGFGLNTQDTGFHPNLWVDVTDFLSRKIELMAYFESEMANHPFPRSEASLRALAVLRGAQIQTEAAEAFMSVKEVEV
ncbi:PIG-L deacetylase family protein [Hydrogenovibrio thermophilus]|uniref:LmbE family protein n=1 Tax=Hydrogenovibrio thermophilus TaxID=265883 RepID=A0A410H430_9GAMM|nr:PIG-L deacetylase family protein [Hydrogenovibrio thermophilus]QAB15580.1 LmbE family protein [Hydrogenovibrio thermophilus]